MNSVANSYINTPSVTSAMLWIKADIILLVVSKGFGKQYSTVPGIIVQIR